MSPETAVYLAKADQLLAEADATLKIDLSDAAGRAAYLAGFHAAQAFISQRTGRGVKTHAGVQGTFHKLVADQASLLPEFRSFLSKTYDLKTIADYATGPQAHTSPAEADEAVKLAHRFVAWVRELLARSSPASQVSG